MNYLNQHLIANQTEPLPGTVTNSAGGQSFAVDDWTRLERFLILGSEGGSYYASERNLTRENALVVERCIKADPMRTLRVVLNVSESGRAPKNDPAILALAMITKMAGTESQRDYARSQLRRVVRTGTHLYHFAAYLDQLGGWGRGTRRAVAKWFNGLEADKLAYQLVKYQSRDGWSSRDLLRLSHPKPVSMEHHALYKWACSGEVDTWVPRLVQAFEEAKTLTSAREVAALVRAHRLPREAVPTQWLTHREVWEALLEDMPLTAMIRNLATMTRVGLLDAMSEGTGTVVARLADGDALKRSKVHPIQVLSALLTYKQGHGERGGNTWTPVSKVVDALDGAFYASFGNVTPTGKRTVLALDVSGSMASGAIAGVPGLTPRIGSVAMAMITQAVEPRLAVNGFSHRYMTLDVSAKRRLDDNIRTVSSLPFERTDCSLPMRDALARGHSVDTFVVYTDSETWCGPEHAHVSLEKYRQKTGINAKLVVVGMVSNGFTIANDHGMLDVVGFDTAAPQVISDFSAF